MAVVRVLDKALAGWLNCSLIDGTNIKLVYSTRLDKVKANQYIVLEGPYRDKVCEIKDRFVRKIDFRMEDGIVYQRDENKLFIPGIIPLSTVVQSKRLKKGTYFIGLPQYPSFKLTKAEYEYEPTGGSRFATTWFPILTEQKKRTSSFLHLGKKSDGCITVLKTDHSTSEWNQCFLSLLSLRSSLGEVARIQII